MLCLMTRKLFSFAKQESMEENPDSLMFQEVLTPGQLYLMFLKVSSTWLFVHLSVSSTAVSTHFHISDVLYSLYICSMVTHTRNSWSAFTHPSAHTYSSEHTHTPWTHTQSSGQPVKLRRQGSSWGLGALLKGTSSWYWRWRERWTFTPTTYNSCRTETRNISLRSPPLYH